MLHRTVGAEVQRGKVIVAGEEAPYYLPHLAYRLLHDLPGDLVEVLWSLAAFA